MPFEAKYIGLGIILGLPVVALFYDKIEKQISKAYYSLMRKVRA